MGAMRHHARISARQAGSNVGRVGCGPPTSRLCPPRLLLRRSPLESSLVSLIRPRLSKPSARNLDDTTWLNESDCAIGIRDIEAEQKQPLHQLQLNGIASVAATEHLNGHPSAQASEPAEITAAAAAAEAAEATSAVAAATATAASLSPSPPSSSPPSKARSHNNHSSSSSSSCSTENGNSNRNKSSTTTDSSSSSSSSTENSNGNSSSSSSNGASSSFGYTNINRSDNDTHSSSSSSSNNTTANSDSGGSISSNSGHAGSPKSSAAASTSKCKEGVDVGGAPTYVAVAGSEGGIWAGAEAPTGSDTDGGLAGEQTGAVAEQGGKWFAEEQSIGGVPKSVFVISCVSATLTMASCVFNTLLPIYMVSELKMSMHSMGMFEGMLEAFSYIVRMFSGIVSDLMTSRKAAITLGFAMGASAKFGMSGASTVAQLFTAKAIDRLANGVQAAPRDALISDLAPVASRSACFGFAQSMRKWGSMVGASMVFVLMKATGNNYQLIFLMAASVSALSCIAFVLLVPNHVRPQSNEEKERKKERQQRLGTSDIEADNTIEGFQLPKLIADVSSMGDDFYRMLCVIAAYTMCHINESMLEARAMEVGFGKAESSLVVAILAGAIFVFAYPLGRLDDRFGPRITFAVGMGSLVLGNLTLMLSSQIPYAVYASLLFLGAHWAIMQGPMLAIVAGFAPPHLRGTAFGIFYSVMALTAIGSNTLFGAVWTAFGARHAFMLSAAMATCLLVALPQLLPPATRRGRIEI